MSVSADETRAMIDECLAGLRRSPRQLPSKYFYDQRGSQLFDQICELPEYYPTRTESAIMREHVGEMAAAIGPGALLIELGSGSSLKTRILLDHLAAPTAYVPIDISREHLLETADTLRQRYPGLEIAPVCADYTQPFELPDRPAQRRVIYFPGSTIGNFHPDEAAAFLQRMADTLNPDDAMLIGVDLRKSPDLLLPAYNDARGVTAAFNLNLLERLNREAGANFDTARFQHRAIWNDAASRIEMHLVATHDQRICLGGETIDIAAGESIWTEPSYKHTLAGFAALARPGFEVGRVWTDPRELFSVQWLVRGAREA